MNNQDISYAQFLVGSNNKLVCGIDTAIKALRPHARYDMSASGGHFEFTRWEDDTDSKPPTRDEIFKELEYQNKFIDYWQHFIDRAANYPDIVTIVNNLWEAMDSGDIPGKGTKFYDSIKEINDKFPKPEGEPPVRPTYE
jgi:hypothetical protein